MFKSVKWIYIKTIEGDGVENKKKMNYLFYPSIEVDHQY